MRGRLNHDSVRGALHRAAGGAIPAVTDSKSDETSTKRFRGGRAKVKGSKPKARLDKRARGGLIKTVGAEQKDAKIARRKKGGKIKKRADGGDLDDAINGTRTLQGLIAPNSINRPPAPKRNTSGLSGQGGSVDDAMDDDSDVNVGGIRPKPNPSRGEGAGAKGAESPRFHIKMEGTQGGRDVTVEPSTHRRGGKVKRRASGGEVAMDDDDGRPLVTKGTQAGKGAMPSGNGSTKRPYHPPMLENESQDDTEEFSSKPSRAKGGGIHIKPSHKGLLHKDLGVPAGKPIPASKLAQAKNSRNPAVRRRATFAANAKKWNH